MTIPTRPYLFVAAVFAPLLASAPAEAQLTCGWCEEDIRAGVTVGGWFYVGLAHRFPGGGNECGWDGSGQGHACSRCGGADSHCHVGWWTLGCHIPCGPTGGAQAALTDIQGALDSGDMTLVASALLQDRSDVSVEFVPEAGSIDLMLSCDPERVFHSIPISPDARVKLEAVFSASFEGRDKPRAF